MVLGRCLASDRQDRCGLFAWGVPGRCFVARRAAAEEEWAAAFLQPPQAAQPWVYWWWLDGNASREGITRDLEEMRRQGIAGVLLFDAGEGKGSPVGPKFMSPAWRELYQHTLHEAARLQIEVGVNLCSGWDAGGTWVTPEHAAKKLVFAETLVASSGTVPIELPKPATVDNFYRDVAVVAYLQRAGIRPRRVPDCSTGRSRRAAACSRGTSHW